MEYNRYGEWKHYKAEKKIFQIKEFSSSQFEAFLKGEMVTYLGFEGLWCGTRDEMRNKEKQDFKEHAWIIRRSGFPRDEKGFSDEEFAEEDKDEDGEIAYED